MQNEPKNFHLAQAEVHRTAHSQDLVEVPKRALLDRKAESHEIHLPDANLAKTTSNAR